MALDTRIPLGVQQVDIANPLALLIQTRQNTQDRAMAAQDRQREIARQSQQDQQRSTEFAQNTQLNAAKIEEFKNNKATQQYIQDTLTVKNLLESNNPQDAALVIQGMQERFKGTDYAKGLDQDYANITAGNLEPVLSGINAEIQAFQEMQQITSGRAAAQDPAAIREYEYLQTLTPEQRQEFMLAKRANPAINLGDRTVITDPTNPAAAPIAQFQRGVSPDAQPELRGQQTAAVEQAEIAAIAPRAQEERRVERELQQGQRIGAIESKQEQTQLLTELLDQAKDLSGFWTTGFVGGAASRIEGTPAYNLSRTLDTLKATAGFDTLQQMRDNSPTGGALGQVTERELSLLQATWGSVEQAQSQAQFERALDRFDRQVKNSWDRVNRAYERDYGAPYFAEGGQQQTSGSNVNDPLGILNR